MTPRQTTDRLQGTLDLLVLKTLAHAPMHGWNVALRIQEVSREALQINQGSLYPALHRLEDAGYIDSEWGTSENNRRARFYHSHGARPEAAGARDRQLASLRRGGRARAALRLRVRAMFSPLHLARRFGVMLHRRSFERRLDEELRFHMDMVASRHLARGISAAQARELTQREFGSMPRFKEEMRDAHGITWIDDLWRDVRFAVRALLRTPGFTAIALLTFALGIGANTAIFSLVNAVLLRPLPFPNAARVVRVFESLKDYPGPSPVSYQNWRDWQQQATSFVALGGFTVSSAILGGEQEPETARNASVTADVFSILGSRPLLGRTFAPEEETKGKDHVVILSEGLWRRRFGGDRAIVGRSIPIEGEPYLIIGVMPASFNFPAGRVRMDVWTPFVPPDQALEVRAHEGGTG